MKKIFLLLLVLFSLKGFGQIESTINLPYFTSGGTTHALIYSIGHVPGKKYPLLVFLHGSGEAGTALTKIYNSSTAGGPSYLIEHALWTPGVLNRRTSLLDTFIVCSPQTNNGWSSSGDDLDGYLTYLVANYPVDTTAMYGMGISSGGGGIVENAAHLNGNEDNNNTSPRRWHLAAIWPLSPATNIPKQQWANVIVADSVRGWFDGDQNNDTYGEYAWDMARILPTPGAATNGFMNIAKLGYARLTGNPGANGLASFNTGHGPWGSLFSQSYRENFTWEGITANMSHYEWLLLNKRPASGGGGVPSLPTANAGSDHTVILPIATTVLTGTADPGNTHTLVTTTWTQVGGPGGATISSQNSLSTNIVGLSVGTFTFRLTAINEASQSATDDIDVIVLANNYTSPQITVGGNPTIVLPTSSTSLTSAPLFGGSTQSKIQWSKQTVPGQGVFRVGVLGSSYPTGAGASVQDSGFMGGYNGVSVEHGLFYDYYHSRGIIDSVVNMAVSGTNIYQVMPTGYVPPSPVHAKLSPSDTPHVATNITALLKHHPNVIFICFPTNGYDVLTISEIMIPYQVIYDSCVANGVQCYIMTTAPRTDATYADPTDRVFLKTVSDSMVNRFGNHAINTYDAVVFTGTTNMIPTYAAADSIHMIDPGHRVFFNKMLGRNVFSSFLSSASSITTPTTQNTTITGLVQGTHRFQVTVTDTHQQDATAIATVTVNASGSATADAGPPQSITLPTSSVTLTGSGSSGATTYSWTCVGGPNPTSITIVSPTSVTTNVTGLIEGVYTFKLTINGGASSANVVITVNPTPPVPSCHGAKYFLTPDPVDSSTYQTPTTSVPTTRYVAGDTIVLPAASSSVDIQGLTGQSGCPIVIVNRSAGQSFIQKRLNLDGCKYVKVTGSGSNNQYGIFIQQDPILRTQNFHAITINNRSRNVEVERVQMHNVDIGIVCETNEDCDNSLNYPNWVLDSMSFHDNKIVGTWNEGLYIGNTSPDNASYDLRPVICTGDTLYPAPMKNGYTLIYNNIVDSTGRGGIQLANAATGISEIYLNTVTHNGMNGDDAQGTGISVGLYTRAYIHNNTVRNTYTWGIASIGAGATNLPLRIENNLIDSSGFLRAYDLATTSRTSYNPATEPTTAVQLPWPQSIEVDTRTRLYTTDTPHPGTAIPGQDSTQFYINGNGIGLKKSATSINVEDNFLGLQKNGNVICGNYSTITGPDPIVVVVPGINYSVTNCQAGLPPNKILKKKPLRYKLKSL